MLTFSFSSSSVVMGVKLKHLVESELRGNPLRKMTGDRPACDRKTMSRCDSLDVENSMVYTQRELYGFVIRHSLTSNK
jgi:hypothetical protein